jgi:hypothetical protein
MSEQDQKKAEELKKLLERMPASGSFESVGISEKIAALAKDLFGRDAATQTGPADQQVALTHK